MQNSGSPQPQAFPTPPFMSLQLSNRRCCATAAAHWDSQHVDASARASTASLKGRPLPCFRESPPYAGSGAHVADLVPYLQSVRLFIHVDMDLNRCASLRRVRPAPNGSGIHSTAFVAILCGQSSAIVRDPLGALASPVPCTHPVPWSTLHGWRIDDISMMMIP